jgi:hypothetical protein
MVILQSKLELFPEHMVPRWTCFAMRIAMGPYYFALTDGERVVGGREPTDLPGLAQVQEEAIAFARAVLRHRHAFGIDDISPWAVRVTTEVGRVLLVLPLSRLKKLHATVVDSVTEPPADR